MLGLALLLLGLGGVALLARSDTAATVAAAGPAPTPVPAAPAYEFPPEVVTHSPAFLAREAAAQGKQEASKVDAQRKVLFLGDSLTASKYWKDVALPGAVVTGRGWAGQGIKKILAEGLPLVDKERPTDVVLLAGVNGVASQHGAARVKADLAAAWAALKGTGARVWAAKLTPWFGYAFKKTKYHAAGPISDAMKAVTREVNGWMQSVAGTADGPDYVIDTSALGDADYNLKAEYSYDGLHMSRRGYKALALLVQQALAALPPPAARVGADEIGPELRRKIAALTVRLREQGVPPDGVHVDWRTVIFDYDDITAATVVDAGLLLPEGAVDLDNKFYRFKTAVRGRDAAVGRDIETAGEEVPADVRRAIDAAVERLERNDAGPAAVAYGTDPQTRYRYATFSFHTQFRADRAADLLGGGTKVGAQMLYFRARVLPEAAVGGAPFAIARQIDALADMLARNDAAPAGHRYEPDALTFLFYTPFRRDRAQALLPPSFTVDGRPIYIYTALRDDVAVGQVVGTDQATPWTCGPAALRAVLRHHGDDVAEDTLAVLAGNVPVLGVRPSGLVKAACELGYRADAFQARGVAALAPFLARDLPVLCVVDSFTQPGRAGHWVVVTTLDDRGNVVFMDPHHPPHNWRTLPRADFDARWWHREGGRVARRLAVVVVPQAFVTVGSELPDVRWIFDVEHLKQVWPLVEGGRASTATLRQALRLAARLNDDVTFYQQGSPEDVTFAVAALAHLRQHVAVGADEERPTHGRTAKLVYKGMPRWLDVLGKVQRGVTKAIVTAFSGGLAAKAWGAAQDKLVSAAEGMDAKEFATWLNNATNEEVAVMRIGQLRRTVQRAREKKAGAVRLYDRLGLTPAAFAGTLEDAMTATLRAELFSWDLAPMVPPQQHLHSLQALTILLYGVDALPLLDARLKAKPRARRVDAEPDQTKVLDWANVTLAVLDRWAEDHKRPEPEFA